MSVEVGPFAVDLAKALILGLLGATAALAVHAGAAVYQDGLRTSVPELWQGGRDRRALAAFSYTISIGFIVAYALPYSLATGIVIIHIILLEIDTIGLRFERRAAAVGIGFLYAAFVAIGIDLFVSFVRSTSGFATGIDQLFAPLAFTFPLLAPVAIANHFGPRWGAVSAVATVIIWRLVEIVARWGARGTTDNGRWSRRARRRDRGRCGRGPAQVGPAGCRRSDVRAGHPPSQVALATARGPRRS
jgi:hypothetical protein